MEPRWKFRLLALDLLLFIAAAVCLTDAERAERNGNGWLKLADLVKRYDALRVEIRATDVEPDEDG
jgi:hypothetical protein